LRNVKKVGRMIGSELRQSWRNERRWYPAVGPSWGVRVYDRWLRKLHWLNLPGRKRVARVRFRGERTSFAVRLGSSDLQLNQTITYRGEYRPLFEHDLGGPVRQIVDLGANAGFTIRLWRRKFPDARIIAVEPDESNVNMCRLNADAVGGGERVQLVRACVDGKVGTVLLDRSGLEQHYHIADEVTDPARCARVDALTVPQILDRCGADEVIDLLKCDIQGAEQAVFADCAEWIGRVRNLVVELHDPYTREAFLSDLERAGWQHERCVVHRTDALWVLFLFNGRQVDSRATSAADREHESAPAGSRQRALSAV
jgi:FkbM family methyltransferase